MKSLTIFNYAEKEVKTITDKNGEPWFIAKDVCNILDISNSRDAVSKLKDSQKKLMSIQLDGWSQARNVTIINEIGLYKLIMRSNKPNAEKFQDWIAEEVLPSIRKTGSYSVPQPQSDIEILARVILISNKTIKQLETKIEKDKPLVEFAETIVDTDDAIDIGSFAKILNKKGIKIGRNRLFALLKVHKFLMKNNVPYQDQINNDCFKAIECKICNGEKLYIKPLITGKGQIAVIKKLNLHGEKQ